MSELVFKPIAFFVLAPDASDEMTGRIPIRIRYNSESSQNALERTGRVRCP